MTKGEEFFQGAEAEDYEQAEVMVRDALSLLMITDSEGSDMVNLLEAMEEEEDYENAEDAERDLLSLLMITETEGEDMDKMLEATEEEEDYENAEDAEQYPLSLLAQMNLNQLHAVSVLKSTGLEALVYLSRILLRVAVYTITYTIGIFPEKYFNDVLPELGMITKQLLPNNEDAVTLIHWIEQGVTDSVKGNYLKTLFFSICERKEGQENEEYAFYFSCSYQRTGKLVLKLSCSDSNTEKLTLRLDEEDLAPQHIRSSACKLIRMCALCTGMQELQEGQYIRMKMINADDMKIKATEYDFNLENINWSLHKKLDESDVSSDSEECTKTSSGLLFCAASRRYPLHLDSGATYHVCGTRECFHNFKKLKEPVSINSVEENELTARHRGDIVYQDVKLKGVLFIARIKFDVVSVGLLSKQGLMTCIGGGQFTIYNVDKPAIVGYGVLDKVKKDYTFCSMDWLETVNSEDEDDFELDEEEDEDEGWIVDSLCANHMVGDKTLLSDCVPVRREFTTASGVIVCTLQGSVRTATMVLNDVLYCKDIGHKLISVSQLDEKGFVFTFYKRRCEIQLRDPIHSSGSALMNYRTNHYILSEFSEERPLPGPAPSPKKRSRGGSKRNRN